MEENKYTDDRQATSSQLTESILQNDQENKQEEANLKRSFLEEGELTKKRLPKQILDLVIDAIPNVASMLSIFYYSFINMFFVKQIGDSLLVGSFGLGVTWFNSTTLCFQIAFGSGLFIQLAQAYGAKNLKLMSELYHRSIAIEFALGIFSSLLLYNTKVILVAFGISEEIASITEQFSVACIPSLFATVLYDTTRQLLISQNIFDIPMNIQLIAYFIHPFWCYLFTQVFDLGIFGIGVARGFTEYIGYFLLCYVIKKKHLCDEIWNIPYDFKSMLSQWIPYLKICIPVGSVIFLQWLVFEFLILLLGRLNDDKILAGQSAFLSIIMFFSMVPLGLTTTSNSYLGNAIGEGKKKICQNFSKITMLACLCEALLFIFLGELLKDTFIDIFKTDDEMEYHFRMAYNLYLYLFLIGDYFQVILNGILRCCDLQNFAAYTYFIAYYFFGLPLACIFTFVMNLGLAGIWISQAMCAISVSIIFFIRISKIEWDQAIKNVQKRVQETKKVIDEELQNIIHPSKVQS